MNRPFGAKDAHDALTHENTKIVSWQSSFYLAWPNSKRPRPVNFVPVFRCMLATFNDKDTQCTHR